MKKLLNIVVWLAALFIAVIFLSSLRYKFSGHPTPEYIFTTLRDWSGIGLFFPAGPWIIGLAEATASPCLIFIPGFLLLTKKPSSAHKFQMLGALIAIGVMSGAIYQCLCQLALRRFHSDLPWKAETVSVRR